MVPGDFRRLRRYPYFQLVKDYTDVMTRVEKKNDRHTFRMPPLQKQVEKQQEACKERKPFATSL